jgi:Bacterial Ig domain
MDAPVQNSVLRGTATLSGWALSEDGIENIAVYVDRSFVQMAGRLNGARPDVISLHPEFAGVTDMEWTVKLETGSLTPGSHDVLTRAISKKGAVRDLGSVRVSIER